jgi:hypothetical protein
VLVAREFVLAERLQPGVQGVDFKPQQHTPDGFENAVDPFDRDTYTKRIVDQDMSNAFCRHSLQRAISEDELPNMPEFANRSGV